MPEYHAFNPLIVRALQKAAQSGSQEDYQQFTSLVYNRPPAVLRDLLSFAPTNPVPLEQVESMGVYPYTLRYLSDVNRRVKS